MRLFACISIASLVCLQAFGATELLKTVKPSGGNYTTLAAAISGNAQDLTASDKWLHIEISGDWSSADTSQVNLDGYTTDATRYILIEAVGNARHQGVRSTTKYHLEANVTGPMLLINDHNVTIRGIQVRNTATSGTGNVCIESRGSGVTMDSLYVYDGYDKGIWVTGGNPVVINNTVVIACTKGIEVEWSSSQPTVTIQNCVLVGGTYGIRRGSGNVTAKNCYAGNNTDDYNGTITFVTCASADATSRSGVTASVAYSTSTGAKFTSVTGGSENFHIQSDSALVNAGTDLSASFTTDFDSQTRVAWDIGADEYIVAPSWLPIQASGFFFPN